ncbi:MAG: TlpA family protein disulfide reductase [Acidobacteria bacterium]|nr:TlpA family protein disulfide reductase [Acidobacteriota bacterium]
MTSEHPAREPKRKIWTGARIALAALTFSLLAVALSSSCNPTDSSRDGSTDAPTSPVAKISPRQPNPQAQPAATPFSPEDALTDEQRNTTMTTLDGKQLKLSDYEGKVVILNVWATWCGPCRKEIPDFIKIQEDYKGRGVEVLGVTSEDERNTAEAVREFVKEYKINYKVVWVDQEGWGAFLLPTGSIPQTYVIGQNGRLLKKFRGYSPQVAVMARALTDEALNNPPTGGDNGRTDKTAK